MAELLKSKATLNPQRLEAKVNFPDRVTDDGVRILDFEFGAAGDDVISRTIGVNQAATYISNVLTNVDTVVYKVNTVTKTLPFSVADTDTLEVTVTRTSAGVLSRVVLST